MRSKLFVPLDPPTLAALRALAAEQRRHPADEAAMIIERALAQQTTDRPQEAAHA